MTKVIVHGAMGRMGKEVIRFVEESADMNLEEPNFEGVRVNIGDGWFLLRLSLHDPLMPLDIQCDSEECL